MVNGWTARPRRRRHLPSLRRPRPLGSAGPSSAASAPSSAASAIVLGVLAALFLQLVEDRLQALGVLEGRIEGQAEARGHPDLELTGDARLQDRKDALHGLGRPLPALVLREARPVDGGVHQVGGQLHPRDGGEVEVGVLDLALERFRRGSRGSACCRRRTRRGLAMVFSRAAPPGGAALRQSSVRRTSSNV